ncbi:MAG TPA: PKD domain-containing protein [Bacteroidia bacterium]|nr:PKD domain-containing protein [Bacteroidia bacterium]
MLKTGLIRTLFTSLFLCTLYSGARAQCGTNTPVFFANLTGSPDSIWISPAVQRDDTCCGATAPDKCLKIIITLDANAMGINFNIASGAVPPGAIYYQINCGPPQLVGTPICLNGAGPHLLTFCKPGNNINSYQITSIPKPLVPDSILIRSGCSQTLGVTGFSVPTVNWTSVPSNTLYNSYLSCTSGCATVNVVPTGTPPAFVDYEVSGFGMSPCQASFYRDTVRVYFYNNLSAGINPSVATICFGSNSVVLTATASGGLGPYTYTWTGVGTGATVNVSQGVYTVTVHDRTGCPPTTATAAITAFTLPITANGGPAQIRCKISPTIALNGSVNIATGGIWSGGNGTFVPSSSVLNATYTPTPAEVSSGSLQLNLSTTGNSGCPPGTSILNITFQNQASLTAGPDKSACYNNPVSSFTASISGYSASPVWSSPGNGVFSSSTSVVTTYTPSFSDLNSGSVSIVLTSSNNGVCPAVKDTVILFITPPPVVNAGPDYTLCSNMIVNLNGTVSGAASSGTWSSSGNGFFMNQASLNTSYAFGSQDYSAGSVKLYLTSVNNGNCLPVKDSLRVYVVKQPTVTIIPRAPICSISTSVVLSGSVTGVTNTGIWTCNGSGNFLNASVTSPVVYYLSIADQASASLVFTLTSTNNSVCAAEQRTFSLLIVPQASMNAGSNQTVCNTSATVALSGSVIPANPVIWSASSNGQFNSSTALNTVYHFSALDVALGSVNFTLTSNGSTICPAGRDTMRVTILKQATVSAGPDLSVCSDNNPVNLNGSVSGVTSSGIWTSSGSGTFPGGNQAQTTYSFSAGDVSTGTVQLIIGSTNNDLCPADADTLILRIKRKPEVDLGGDSSICYKGKPYYLNPKMLYTGSTFLWITNGTGTFSPGNYTVPVYYHISSNDVSMGNILFTFFSTNNGACGNVSSSAKLFLKPSPVASFSASSLNLLLPNNTVHLSNLSSQATTYTWTFGNGLQSNAVSPTAVYEHSGDYTITLVASNDYKCSDTSDVHVQVTSEVIFPNAFTPNPNSGSGGSYNPGDLQNDVFFPFTDGVTEYNLMIFNRWGEQLFVSTDIKIGWDGYFNGKLCQQDVYVWKADIKFFDGRTFSKTGTVSLIR